LLVQIGVACFAFLAGLACFYGALYFGFTRTAALFAAVIFAVLVWISARSLLREAIAEIYRSRQHSEGTDESRPGGGPPR
jgi:hypothetical protein